MVGRRLHKGNNEFGKWVKEYGFADIRNSTRSAAMWLAGSHLTVTVKCPIDMTHPNNLRQWHRENLKSNPELPSDLQDLTIEPSAPSVTLDTRSAERLSKVINRAKDGGEGAVIRNTLTRGEISPVPFESRTTPSPSKKRLGQFRPNS